MSSIVRFYVFGNESICEGYMLVGHEDAYTERHENISSRVSRLPCSRGQSIGFRRVKKTVMYSFSNVARDVLTCFTEPHIERDTHIKEA